MRHATSGVEFRARAYATLALLAIGASAVLRGLIEALP